jgi:hypothetical protein
MPGVGAMPHEHHAMSPSPACGKHLRGGRVARARLAGERKARSARRGGRVSTHVVLKVRLPLASGGVHEMTMSGPGPRPISPARARAGNAARRRVTLEIFAISTISTPKPVEFDAELVKLERT